MRKARHFGEVESFVDINDEAENGDTCFKDGVKYKVQCDYWTEIEKADVASSALDVQIGGDHYKSMAIQPVEFIHANNLSFLAGCVVKRISRFDKPTGKGLQDLEKIKHEVDLLIELMYGDKK